MGEGGEMKVPEGWVYISRCWVGGQREREVNNNNHRYYMERKEQSSYTEITEERLVKTTELDHVINHSTLPRAVLS